MLTLLLLVRTYYLDVNAWQNVVIAVIANVGLAAGPCSQPPRQPEGYE